MPGRRHSDGTVHGVIVGCPRADGRWLLIRRSWEMSAAPGKICFPGGAIEVGETQEQAAVREMAEELGAAVSLRRCVWQHAYEEKPLKLWCWLGRLESSQLRPNPAEVAQVLWLTAHQAASHPDTLPYQGQIVEALVKAVCS